MKKYIAVAAGVILQACLGGIYAWSAFVPDLREQFGYSSAQTQLIFGSTIGVLSVVMLYTGRLQDRFGPRRLGMLAGLFLTAQYVCAGSFGSRFAPLWLSMSGLGGLAVGCGYVCPLSTGVKWFPHRKGLISGLAVAGYGGGAIILSALAQYLFSRGWDAPRIFRAVGCVYGPLTVLMGSLFFTPPAAQAEAVEPYPFTRLLKDRRYWALATGIFCGTFPGLVLIGNLKPIGLADGLPAAAAAAAIGVLAAGNSAGRIVWGGIQDRLGARAATLLCLSFSTVSVWLFLLGHGQAQWFLGASAFLGFCYGGGLSLYAAQAAHEYGASRLGSTYPLVLLAHGVAAIVGPPIGGWTRDLSGSFQTCIAMAIAVNAAGVAGYAWLTRQSKAACHP